MGSSLVSTAFIGLCSLVPRLFGEYQLFALSIPVCLGIEKFKFLLIIQRYHKIMRFILHRKSVIPPILIVKTGLSTLYSIFLMQSRENIYCLVDTEYIRLLRSVLGEALPRISTNK